MLHRQVAAGEGRAEYEVCASTLLNDTIAYSQIPFSVHDVPAAQIRYSPEKSSRLQLPQSSNDRYLHDSQHCNDPFTCNLRYH